MTTASNYALYIVIITSFITISFILSLHFMVQNKNKKMFAVNSPPPLFL